MSLMRGFFANALVSVHLDMRDCRILLRLFKNGATSFEETKTFRCAPNTLPIEAAYYLSRIHRRHPFTYIATVSHSLYQGACEANSDEDLSRFGVNPTSIQRIIVGRRWSIFIDKNAVLNDMNNFIKAPSLDFLYSPFLLLYQAVRSRLDGVKRLYVFLQQSDVTILIMDAARLYYAAIQPLDTEPHEKYDTNDDSPLDEDNQEIGQLSDLDDISTQADFDEGQDNQTPEGLEAKKRELIDFARVSSVGNLLKEALNEFYSNDTYESDFVSEVIVIDGTDITSNAASFLKTNLMIDTEVLSVDVCKLMIEIAQHDLLEA